MSDFVYRETGSGEPVLVLHGWGCTSDTMGFVSAALAEAGFRAIAVDFPGVGGVAPEPGVPWTVHDYADWTLALMDELGLARCHIVAHSFGGRVALLIAATRPERVGKMVLTGCAGLRRFSLKRTLRIWGAKIGRMFGRRGSAGGSADYRALKTEAMRATFRNVVNLDLTPLLPRIAAPTLLLWGKRDDATPPWMAHRIEKRAKNVGLVWLEGDHFAFAQNPGEFCRVATYFLGQEGK